MKTCKLTFIPTLMVVVIVLLVSVGIYKVITACPSKCKIISNNYKVRLQCFDKIEGIPLSIEKTKITVRGNDVNEIKKEAQKITETDYCETIDIEQIIE